MLKSNDESKQTVRANAQVPVTNFEEAKVSVITPIGLNDSKLNAKEEGKNNASKVTIRGKSDEISSISTQRASQVQNRFNN